MEPIVDIQGLSYAYRGFEDKWVLREIDLQIQPREFIAVAGRTGSGKSTLCYALNGLVPKSFGGKMEGTVLSRCSEFLSYFNWDWFILEGKETKSHGSFQTNIPCLHTAT